MVPAPASRSRRSAGILMFRPAAIGVEVLLVHPGGPMWARRDAGAWSIPKGEFQPGEEPLAAAQREFEEELGSPVPAGRFHELGEVRQRSGKIVHAWALAGDIDAEACHSNTFMLEWPPRSGRFQEVPEVDRAQWFDLAEARIRINPAQVALLDRLADVGLAAEPSE